ncbi:MAG: TlyA family rRNA (cytidine-2'-O)-methyltransferase [Spirochaeta sp.]|nr:TlyA family rRNA (cytidine-2'-O)-methyltransferase [Spirochaeta sp.]
MKNSLIQVLSLRFPEIPRKEIFARILCGEVLVSGERTRNPELKVAENCELAFAARRRFVSRGGGKLDFVLNKWNIDCKGRSFIDAGCSTGGFSDCLLQRGAAEVVAVDVGYNLLDYSLRKDKRIILLERTNIFDIRDKIHGLKPAAAVMDLSFRSLRGAASFLLRIVEEGWIIALVKPQFEWRDPDKDFNGVVYRKESRYEIVLDTMKELWQEGAFTTKIASSPILGSKGNAEYFFHLKKSEERPYPDMQRRLKEEVLEGIPG